MMSVCCAQFHGHLLFDRRARMSALLPATSLTELSRICFPLSDADGFTGNEGEERRLGSLIRSRRDVGGRRHIQDQILRPVEIDQHRDRALLGVRGQEGCVIPRSHILNKNPHPMSHSLLGGSFLIFRPMGADRFGSLSRLVNRHTAAGRSGARACRLKERTSCGEMRASFL